MKFERSGGILLHPTSLPGRYGIGDLGDGALQFIDFLEECGLRLWQILPLGPTGYGNSPYQTLSAFAGNHLLVSLERLVQEGLLNASDLADMPSFPASQVDFGKVIPFHTEKLATAYQNFRHMHRTALNSQFDVFCHDNAEWLEDYALFGALKDHHHGVSWTDWEPELVHREPRALKRWRERLAARIDAVRFDQFLFFRQWLEIKQIANNKGIAIVGDMPIFIAHDSVDVWAHPELFFLDEDGKPELVAGVPPDYFSATGQLWGNPLYRWPVMARDNYAWWIARMRAILTKVDIVRLDHFRGFEAYWEVPASEETAVNGRWVKGPGAALFHALQDAFGELPIIAEDLGMITQDVEALRRQFEFPGMRILQFAFGDDASSRGFRPHNFPRNTVVYTGTHDNDTCIGWFASEGAGYSTRSNTEVMLERQRALAYMGCDGTDIHWHFIRLALSSVAAMAILPLQDILGLGSAARMNQPGNPDGNWEWRFQKHDVTVEIIAKLANLVELYDRAGSALPQFADKHNGVLKNQSLVDSVLAAS